MASEEAKMSLCPYVTMFRRQLVLLQTLLFDSEVCLLKAYAETSMLQAFSTSSMSLSYSFMTKKVAFLMLQIIFKAFKIVFTVK